jgi:hypothetical protein
MAATNRSDIAIETAQAIDRLLEREGGLNGDDPTDVHPGLSRARGIVATFVEATRFQQGTRVGRPRKPKAEA